MDKRIVKPSKIRFRLKPNNFTHERTTPQQKKFAQIVAKTGDIRQATLAAYTKPEMTSDDALEKGEKILSKKNVALEVIKVWNKIGMKLDVISMEHFKIMKSRASSKSDKLRAIDMAYRVHGAYVTPEDGKEKAQGAGGQVTNNMISILNLYVHQRQTRGLPVEKEVTQALEDLREVKIQKGEKIDE